jgi:hypothetical protein
MHSFLNLNYYVFEIIGTLFMLISIPVHVI